MVLSNTRYVIFAIFLDKGTVILPVAVVVESDYKAKHARI